MRTMNLEPIDPETAVELYLMDRETELRQATIRSHRSSLNHFIRWCEQRGITDDHGRKPLLTTSQGRMSRITIDGTATSTRDPARSASTAGMDPETCEYRPLDDASKCPSSVSPHPFRRGAITHYLANDVPETAVSRQANVSPDGAALRPADGEGEDGAPTGSI